jgi:Zn finger protein HypA/HybF involved in hydrogenase expression
MNWFQQLRVRVLVVVIGAALGLFALLSWIAWPIPAIVGVTVITVAALVNTMTSKLDQVTCLSCGEDLSNEPTHAYGMVCPSCGGITQPNWDAEDLELDDADEGNADRLA